MNNIKRFFLKYRLNIASGIAVVLSFVAVLSIYFTLEVRVLSNDECLWSPKESTGDKEILIYFDKVKINGVAWNAGIRNGDLFLEIAGVKLKNAIQAQEILDSFKEGELVEYVVKKQNGEILKTKVFVKKLIQLGDLARGVNALLFLLIGFIVFSAKPDGLSQRLFFALGIFAVLSISEIILLPLDIFHYKFIADNPLQAFIIGTVSISSKVFGQFTMLYFIWTFPNPFAFAVKKAVWKSALAFASFLSLTGIAILFIIIIPELISFEYFEIYKRVIGIISLIIYIVSGFSLVIQYVREKNPANKKPLLLFVIAFSFGMVIQLYVATIAPAISDIIFNSPEYYTPIILVIFVPITFAYAIFKYNLMDVSIVIRNTIIYGTAMATVAGIYFVVIYLLGQAIGSFVGAENKGLVAGVFFLIFAFVFQSTKDKFQNFLTRRFYPEQFAYQKVLVQFSNDVSTVVGTEKILDLTNETFLDALKIKKFGILLRDFQKDTLYLSRSLGFSETNCVIEKSNIINQYKEKLLISKYPEFEQQDFETIFPGKSQRMIDEGIYTVIPMIVKSKVIGALLFGLKHSGSKFGGKDIELLTAAANQIAISLENARLYKSETEKIKIERDLDLARKIQQGLLPKSIPNITGLDICGEMIPAMQVGGDYFDLIKLSDTKIYVAVGDVSGKGLSASLYMTKLQTMIQLACSSSSTPKDVLVEINKRLYNSIERNWFITMTLALFDIEKRTVKLCRAGHMPLLAAYNGTVESIRTNGIGLGLERGDIFDRTLVEEELSLKSGQIFAFFSDGLTEAMNEKDELFGEDKLSELLKGKTKFHSVQLMQNVWDEIQTFRGAAQPNDDMTMVIVKVS